MDWFLARAREHSTWRGIAAALVGLGLLDAQQAGDLAQQAAKVAQGVDGTLSGWMVVGGFLLYGAAMIIRQEGPPPPPSNPEEGVDPYMPDEGHAGGR
jgi:hypothetical protein